MWHAGEKPTLRVTRMLSLAVRDRLAIVSRNPEPGRDGHYTGIGIGFECHGWWRSFVLSANGKRPRVDVRHRPNRCKRCRPSRRPGGIHGPAPDAEPAQLHDGAIGKRLRGSRPTGDEVRPSSAF